jgi:hypothetical protein
LIVVPKLEAPAKVMWAVASAGTWLHGASAQVAPPPPSTPAAFSPAQTITLDAVDRPEEEQSTLKSVDTLLADENQSLSGLMKPTLFHPRIDPILAAVGIAAFLLADLDHPLSTLEPRLYCHLVAALGGLCAITLVGMTWRMWLMWKETRLLLITLDSRPIRRAFVRIGGISAKPFQIGTNSEGDFSRLLSRAYEAAKCVVNRGIIPGKEINDTLAYLCAQRESAEDTNTKRGLLGHFKCDRELIGAVGAFQKAMANAVAKTMVFLVPEWASARSPVLDEQNTGARRTQGQLELDPIDDTVRVAEHFVCTHYVNFILMVLVRIRAFMTAIVGMYVLIVLAFNVYPFEPSLVLRTLMAILLVFIVGIAALVYGGMHRDITLSHITDTTPGELGGDFWLRMTSFVALPLFSLAAAAFPEFSRLLFSWLEPALEALK